MTPLTPEEERELDEFTAALHGESPRAGAAGRLGDILRKRRAQALASRDEPAQMRVWKAIDSKLPPVSQTRASPSAWDRLRFAQAAALVVVGIGAGWLLRPGLTPQVAESRLEFSYGDLEKPRGGIMEKSVGAPDPTAAVRRLTDALIADAAPFELYSVGGDTRRVLFAAPAAGSHGADVMRGFGIVAPAGETLALTITRTAER